MFGGLVGLGGGVVIVPMLTKYLKLTQHKAHGTSLVALIFTGLVGSMPYLVNQRLDIPSALVLSFFAMATAHLGAKYCRILPEFLLRRYFGLFLMAMAFFILTKPYLNPLTHPIVGVGKWMVLAGIGLATGFLSGLMGIGGGALMIACMVLLLGYDQHLAQGTSLFAMIPGSIIGGWTHWKNGFVALNCLGGLIGGIILGALIGGICAQYISGGILRAIFAGVLTWLGYRYIKSSYSKETSDDSQCRL